VGKKSMSIRALVNKGGSILMAVVSRSRGSFCRACSVELKVAAGRESPMHTS